MPDAKKKAHVSNKGGAAITRIPSGMVVNTSATKPALAPRNNTVVKTSSSQRKSTTMATLPPKVAPSSTRASPSKTVATKHATFGMSRLGTNQPPPPPNNTSVIQFHFDCDELESKKNGIKCKISRSDDSNPLADFIQEVLEELLKDPLRLPPLDHMLLQMAISFIVDELALLVGANDASLLKMVLKTTVTSKLLGTSRILVQLVVKNIRIALHMKKLDEVIKRIAVHKTKEVADNVTHRMHIHRLRKMQL